ncbi:MAG: DUF861 domain-containing protein [Proteobacteria bacterium]|nr:DUF861 domain-containing protein [Pseudomonadota bacterium]
MPNYFKFDNAGAETVTSGPLPERLMTGRPSWKIRVQFSGNDMTSGEWESTPGRWRVDYDRWEFFHVLSGKGVVRGDDGGEIVLKPGTAAVLTPGFKDIWEVEETLRKYFFVRRIP